MNDKRFDINLDGKHLTCYYIVSKTVAEKYVQKLLERSTSCLGFDIETGKKNGFKDDPVSGLCPYRSFPSLLQFYDGIDSIYMFDLYYLPLGMFGHIFDSKRLVAHNAIFDASHMAHHGFKDLKIDCTMIQYNLVRCAEYATIEDEEEAIEELHGEEGDGIVLDWLTKGERYSASLRAVTAKLLGVRVEKDQQTSNWTDRPLNKEQLIYAAKDSYFTFEIGRILTRKIKDLGLGTVYKLNRDAIHPVVQMTLNGCEINICKHIQDCKKWEKEKDALQIEVLRTFGNRTNLNSPVQISNWMEKNLPVKYQHRWPRSPKTGMFKSDARTLDMFSDIPVINPLLRYKKLEKLLSTYGYGLVERINPVTGRLHGSFTLGYTSTGRLSSRAPNLQNLPRGADIRSIFRAGSDSVFVGADYGQIELRTAAELSRDPVMLRAYQSGHDLHSLTASRITGKKIDRVTKEDRQIAKSLNFGLLFGLGAKGLIEYARWTYGVRLSQEEAYEHYKTFFDTYKGYAAWQLKIRNKCEKTLLASTRLGKFRKLQPHRVFTTSVNQPVQGSAAEVVIKALCNVYKNGNVIKLINCVHDELLIEVEKGKEQEGQQVLKESMESAMLSIFPKACLNKLVDAKIGSNWAETK